MVENLTQTEHASNQKDYEEVFGWSGGRANKEGFNAVSRAWYAQTSDYDDLAERIAQNEQITHDVTTTIGNVVPRIIDGNLKLNLQGSRFDGLNFDLTEHSMTQLGSPQYVNSGRTILDKLIGEDSDLPDNEVARLIINNGLRKLDPEKQYLIRVRVPENNENPTCRAFLTDRYGIIDHQWFLDVIKEGIPGGRISHMDFDGDRLRFNSLIPDSIREEDDSDYGGMLSCSNNEVGGGRQKTTPSIFRAICMNGCIWGEVRGGCHSKVHRGNIQLEQLKAAILQNLQAQIPLLPQGIERMLGIRALGTDGVSVPAMVAQVAREYRGIFTKQRAGAIVTAFVEEPGNTAFHLVNAFTRAAQNRQYFDGMRQVTIEETAGDLMNRFSDTNRGKDAWDTFKRSAVELRERDKVKAFLPEDMLTLAV